MPLSFLSIATFGSELDSARGRWVFGLICVDHLHAICYIPWGVEHLGAAADRTGQRLCARRLDWVKCPSLSFRLRQFAAPSPEGDLANDPFCVDHSALAARIGGLCASARAAPASRLQRARAKNYCNNFVPYNIPRNGTFNTRSNNGNLFVLFRPNGVRITPAPGDFYIRAQKWPTVRGTARRGEMQLIDLRA